MQGVAIVLHDVPQFTRNLTVLHSFYIMQCLPDNRSSLSDNLIQSIQITLCSISARMDQTITPKTIYDGVIKHV